MSDPLLPEGGPHNIRRTDAGDYQFSIGIPTDDAGMVGHACPDEECAPGYFKIRLGTGLTGEQPVACCPYCRHPGALSDFHTKAQKDYAVGILTQEVLQGISRKLGKAVSGGLFTLKMGARAPVPPPLEEELSRELVCPSCTLEHAVYGLAFWCPDCGADVFLTHIQREIGSIQEMIAVIPARRTALGTRVAARDVENALEDVVSVFEAAGKQVLGRWLRDSGKSREQVAGLLGRRVRNQLQNIGTASTVFTDLCGFDPLAALETSERDSLEGAFAKRHPITHNLGVVDRKYLARARTLAEEGRELRVTPEEVSQAADIAFRVIKSLHEHLYPTK